uniref:DUF148 domain-containing protein n=1 Tax=Panagrellus redivivus TaxID=6233 RepID=A0A7E4W8D1_PANRE
MISIFVLSITILPILAQPWHSRFADYNDYEPVLLLPPDHHIQHVSRPIEMRAAPRYRPLGGPVAYGSANVENPPTPAMASFFPMNPSTDAKRSAPSPAQSSSDTVSDFMNRLVTTLPQIAEKVAKMAPPEGRSNNNNNQNVNNDRGFNNFGSNSAEEFSNLEEDFTDNIKKSGLGMFFVTERPSVASAAAGGFGGGDSSEKPEERLQKGLGSLFKSMPDPNSLFSFDNLFKAFSNKPPTPEATTKSPSQSRTDDKIYDMRLVHGTPILKEEDESSEVIQKPDEFVEGFTATAAPTPTTTTANPAENLLGTILSGKLDQVDWIGALFKPNSIAGAGEQNPLSTFFKGGFFGSGLDDDSSAGSRAENSESNSKITKPDDRNFFN